MELTLGTRLMGGFIIALMIPILVISTLVIYSTVDELNEHAEDHTALLLELKTNELELTELELEHQVEALVLNANTISAYQQGFADSQNAEVLLENILREDASLYHVRLYDPSSLSVIAQLGPEPPNIPLNRLSSYDPSETRVGSIYRANNTDNDALIDIAVPIWNSAGDLVGQVIVTQNLTQADSGSLPNLVGIVENQPEGFELPEAYLGLLDLAGTLLLSSDRQVPPFESFFEHPPIQRLRQTGGNALQVEDYDSRLLDTAVIGGYAYLPEHDWVLVVEVPKNTVLEPLYARELPLVIIAVIILIFVNALWLLGIYRFTEMPIRQLTHTMRLFSLSERHEGITPVNRRDEFGVLHNAFVQIAQETFNNAQSNRQVLMSHERRWEILQDAERLSQQISSLDYWLDEVVRVLRQKLPNIQSIQLFMVDTMLRLKAATSEEGLQRVKQGYQLPISEDHPVGQVALSGESKFIADTELILPIKVGSQTAGILDLVGTFVEEDLPFYRIIAIQIGVTMWAKTTGRFMSSQPHLISPQLDDSLAAQAGTIAGQADTWTPLQYQVMGTGVSASQHENDKVRFAVPIRLRDEMLGAVEWTVDANRFNTLLMQTAEILVGRLALALDNARLFEQSQRLIKRERFVNEISQKLTMQTDVRQILQVAVRELGIALGSAETQISLNKN